MQSRRVIFVNAVYDVLPKYRVDRTISINPDSLDDSGARLGIRDVDGVINMILKGTASRNIIRKLLSAIDPIFIRISDSLTSVIIKDVVSLVRLELGLDADVSDNSSYIMNTIKYLQKKGNVMLSVRKKSVPFGSVSDVKSSRDYTKTIDSISKSRNSNKNTSSKRRSGRKSSVATNSDDPLSSLFD